MLRALDDIPVHGRQLGDMVRGLRGKQRRNRDGIEDIDTFDVTLRPFKRNRKHDPVEYDRQYNEQMDALQQMPLSDWLRNRTEYLQNGRTPDSLRAQENARAAALKAKILELREQGQSRSEAAENASSWLATQAATHRLDGIAGGNVTDISGVGDARINSSLGSQWRSRVGDIDAAVVRFIQSHPGADLSDVYMNVTFR
ncbi:MULTISPECIES: polymorphic toxin type 15 domain-containing protein [Microbacterium]|uniref:Polymorphic toxin type 15 domain-containing protein n=1 Tax=Microbacterium aquilitoris TaxID=3067307 RepID=A0ABU3GLJ4_9MICO|nr:MULTISPECIES: polymorphic toxin type 15 domain-containing protein [unclassified Microbacterium]MDT3330419.1 polymorphic toxin type 15 domain-containing protein [Microbacterium sp. KSW-18]MDT3344825.1 polymorphic toxin type 15 domain-containing protein [Microbacterium sp. KSW2-22]